MDRGDKVKIRYEKVRESLAKRLREKYDRVLPLDEMLSDRWKKAKLLGFGEGTSVYVYGKPKIGKNVWVGPFVILRAQRPEAVKAGFAKVVGTEKDSILTAITEILKGKVKLLVKSPFGDGDAGEKIAQIVKRELT